VLLDLVGQLVTRDAGQEFQQFLRRARLVLAEGGADKKRAQHRLADIHGIQDAPHAAVTKLNAHNAADDRLVLAHQLRRGRLIPSPHAPDQTAKRRVLPRHA
jgi:hypothetical protein